MNSITIRLDKHPLLGNVPGAYSGATADVFDVDGIAHKAFRIYAVSHNLDGVKARFQLECEAYIRAAADPWLKKHIALFSGPVTIDDVLDEQGTSVAHKYALGCCYRIETLTGNDVKFTTAGLRQDHRHLQEAQSQFERIGVDVLDSSVFNHEDAERFKFIDFRLK